jgi:hypothetical protein
MFSHALRRETVHISSPPEIISVAVVILKFNAVHMAAAVSLDMFFPGRRNIPC